MKKFLKSMFSSGGLSSKRVMGTIGLLICFGVTIYCTICGGMQAPDIAVQLMWASFASIGLGCVDTLIKNKYNGGDDPKNDDSQENFEG